MLSLLIVSFFYAFGGFYGTEVRIPSLEINLCFSAGPSFHCTPAVSLYRSIVDSLAAQVGFVFVLDFVTFGSLPLSLMVAELSSILHFDGGSKYPKIDGMQLKPLLVAYWMETACGITLGGHSTYVSVLISSIPFNSFSGVVALGVLVIEFG